jgi:hypothetical protein
VKRVHLSIKEVGMPTPGWLRDYWEGRLRSALTQWEQEHAPETQLKALFEQMLIDWPQIRKKQFSDYTIGTYVTKTREWLSSLPSTDTTSFVDPETGQRQHIALKYFNLAREEWAELAMRSLGTLEQRNKRPLVLSDPYGVIARAQELLLHDDWAAIAAGILVLLGCRVGEVLIAGDITLKTLFSVTYRGRLKLRGKPDYAFEKPTLCEAPLLISGWERLRTHPDLLAMNLPIGEPSKANLDVVNGKLYPKVRQAVDHFFADLVPSPGEGEDKDEKLFSHLMRSLYATLAIWLYCPRLRVDPDTYRATILGQRYYFRAQGQERVNYMSQHFYHRFVIAPGGKVDDRCGIALEKPGVCVLEAFKQERGDMDAIQQQATAGKRTRKRKRKERNSSRGYTMIRLLNESGKRFDRIAEANDLDWKPEDDTFVLLLDTYDAHQRCQQEPGRAAIVPSQLTLEQLGLPEQLVKKIREAMSQGVSFEYFLQHALEREANTQIGLARTKKEREQKSQPDFSQVPTTDLLKTRRAPEAIERIRRAIATLIEYNKSCDDQLQRWFITQTLLRDFTGAHPRFIKPVLNANAALIKQHHEDFGITSAHNRTPIPKSKGIKETSLRIAETVAELPVLNKIVWPSLDAISDGSEEEEAATSNA